jgi:hypothetical protein
MEVQIRVVGGGDDVAALRAWLSDEDELRGRVKVASAPVSETELGSALDLLTVTLGAGGAGTVLVSSLITWLQTRRTTVKLTVEAGGRSVTLDVETVGEVAPLLEQVFKAALDGSDGDG